MAVDDEEEVIKKKKSTQLLHQQPIPSYSTKETIPKDELMAPVQGVRLLVARRKLLPKPHQSSCSIITPFFVSGFTMSCGCTASAIHQHSNIPEIKKGYEDKSIATVGKGEDRAQLSCLDHRGVYQYAETLV